MRNVKLGTGKTHTLIEVIRQLTTASTSNSKPNRVLVCGASNLSVDNILERLLALPAADKAEKLKVTRIGHPARVMSHEGILDSTLDVKATRTDQVSVNLVTAYLFLYQTIGGPR
jgi:DNA polymerase alpha-associated DNA helicase A